MPEITPKRQTDIKRTEHDFHRLTEKLIAWKAVCYKSCLQVAEALIVCGAHALTFVELLHL